MPDARGQQFFGNESDLRAWLDMELENVGKLPGGQSGVPAQRKRGVKPKGSASLVTDRDLESLARLITPIGQRLKWSKTGEGGLLDGVYIVDSAASPRSKWVLSIYRNVKAPSNDVEIAIDVGALVNVADGDPAREPAAQKWLDWQKTQLHHADHPAHLPQVPAFRIGLKLHDAKVFLTRLQSERSSVDRGARWTVDEATASPGSTGEAGRKGDQLQATITRMLSSARDACAQSGKPQTTLAKTKLFGLEGEDGRRLLERLLEPRVCAVTGIPLDFSGADSDLAPSLDRKDPDGHYEPDNVQVVAWFINRWKSDDSQANFDRLLRLVAQADLAQRDGTRSQRPSALNGRSAGVCVASSSSRPMAD